MHALASHAKLLLFAALLVAGLWAQRNYSIRSIPEDATFMEPSVHRRGLRIFGTDAEPPARGSIVWFESPAVPGKMLLSRVVGLAGDRIGLDDGRLVRDGAVVAEDYALKRVAREDLPEIVVPEGHAYVLNDARDDAWSAFRDSRRLGPIPLAAVVGKIGDPVVERQFAARRAPKAER